MRFAKFFRAENQKSELDEEIAAHLAMAATDKRNRGADVATAEQEASREFGNTALIKDLTRNTWGWLWLERLQQDLKYALRQMRRSPTFAATVIETLALGIAATTAMFTVVDHMLLRPLPYRDAKDLVLLQEKGPSADYRMDVPWPDIQEWMKLSRSFEQIAFSGRLSGRNYLEGNTTSLEISGISTTSNLFPTLGVAPALGRDFLQEPPGFAANKNTGTVILSYPVWQAAFAGQTSILGRTVKIDDQPYTVIGIMPRGFSYPIDDGRIAQVWVPIQLSKDDDARNHNGHYTRTSYTPIARLRKGVALSAARAEMAAIQKTIAPEYTDAESRKEHSQIALERYGDSLIDADMKKALLALLAASGVLWLIAAVNAMNLLLARSTARQREIAVRGALGAGRWRVVQQVMTEGLVLSAAAAVLGIGLAMAGIRLAESARPLHLDVDLSPHINLIILAALCALTLLTALISTAWPALIAARTPIEPALRQGGLQTGTGRHQHRLRGGLVAAEIAMSLTLLVTCGLLLRTIYKLRHVPLGYRTDHIIVANLSIPSFRYTNQDVTQALYNPMLERVQHLHGVQSAGLMSEVPLGQTFNIMLSMRMNGNEIAAALKPVSSEIQRVFDFKMLAGRFFNDQDSPSSEPVVVVNPAFARLYAPNRHDPASVVGLKFWDLRKNAPLRIIGVQDNERQKSIAEPSQPEVEICLCQITPDSGAYQPSTIAMDLAVRTARPTAEIIPDLRAILRQASPELANSTITTMDQIVEDSYGSQRLAAHLLEIFGGSALLLCIAGLYGLLAYVVTQRTRELGVRIALGAQRGDVIWLVMRQAATLVITGVAIGLALAFASTRLIRSYLYGVSAHDTWTLVAVAVVLLLSGAVAAYLPARRAAQVNPVEALRAE
jgi:predicted permease